MTRRVVLVVGLLVGLAVVLIWRSWPPGASTGDGSPVDTVAAPTTQTPPSRAWRGGPLRLSPAEVDTSEERSRGESSLSGRVIDWSTGHGIAGAELTFLRDRAAFSTMSGVDGAFALRVGEAGIYQLATVTAPGYVPFAPTWQQSPIRFAARLGQHLDGAQIHLMPTGTWQITVIDDHRKTPVVGARIALTDDGAPAGVSSEDLVITDGAGRATIEGAPRGTIVVEHPGFVRAFAGLGLEPHPITVRLRPTAGTAEANHGSISGRVLDPDGTPIPDATVETWQRRRGAPPAALSVNTDLEGRFAFTDLRGGTYRLAARYGDYVIAYAEKVATGTDDVVLQLQRSGILRGRVIDARTGAPIPAFTIVYRAGPGRRIVSYFDAEGRFEARGLPARSVTVRAMAHGYAASARLSTEVPAEAHQTTDIELELFSEARIWGRVLDAATSAPVAGTTVYAEGQQLSGDHAIDVAARTTSDAGGNFELGGLALGLRSLRFEAEGYNPRIVSGLTVEEEGSIGPLEIELTAVAEGDKPHLELSGIGATLDMRPDELIVRRTFEGGGAAEMGLSEGDAIISVDGTAVSDMSGEDAIERIRGQEGTIVELGIRSKGSDEVVEITVVRRRIETS